GNPAFVPTPPVPSPETEILISPTSTRLAALAPFSPFPPHDLRGLRVLVKVKGQCTTDTISAAGPWLKYKGHLPNISANTLIGAVNAETGETNVAYDHFASPSSSSSSSSSSSPPPTPQKYTIPSLAAQYKSSGHSWLLVAEDNYGEGSAREHAALQPRFLGCRVVLAKSFARIHEANLKKQGVVPLTFADPRDYEEGIREGDVVETVGLWEMLEKGGRGDVWLRVQMRGGKGERMVEVRCGLSEDQAAFIRAGSALNLLAKKGRKGGE
ncbi:MAG: hypothetical protein Q9210_004284, partial [Variospora velana]